VAEWGVWRVASGEWGVGSGGGGGCVVCQSMPLALGYHRLRLSLIAPSRWGGERVGAFFRALRQIYIACRCASVICFTAPLAISNH
jgi:hypothetical protein